MYKDGWINWDWDVGGYGYNHWELGGGCCVKGICWIEVRDDVVRVPTKQAVSLRGNV